MAADENGGGGADARLSVQHIVQRLPALRVWRLQVWCCKSVWRQVWQVWRQVWPLQGRCRAVTLAPPFNGAAAVKCFSAVFKFSVFFLRGFKQEQKYLRIAI